MDSASQRSATVPTEALVEAMRQETEELLRGVMAVVNDAPDGAWINGSEMHVRELLGEYRRRVFEKALQMRVEAAEAARGAFSPDRPRGGDEEQGA